MGSKRKMYIIIIAVAAAVLLGLIIWAICLNINNSVDSTETTGGQAETTSQSADDTSAETTDTTAEVTDQIEDTTDATDATETTGADEKKPSGNSNSGGQSNSGDTTDPTEDNKPDNKPNNDPDSGNDPGSTPTEPGPTGPTEPSYPYNVTWKEYDEMSEEEQIAFYKCFKNHNDFKQWRTAAKAAYDETKIEIEIGEDGKIDLGQITGKN